MSLEAGLTVFKRGQYADAIAHLETYCTECQTLGSTGSRNYMQAGMALVKAYHAEKQFDRAIAQCEAFMASDKNPALQIWADKTYPKLQKAQNEPEPDAQSESESKSTAESHDALRLLESGIGAQKKGDDEAAIKALESYLETCRNVRSRNYMQAQISRVKAYRSSGQLERAYAICEELQTIDNAALQSWASKAISALRQAGVGAAESEKAQSDSAATPSDSSNSDAEKSAPYPKKRSPTTVPRKPPIRPGVARMLDNTSTVEISAAAGTSSFSSDLSSQATATASPYQSSVSTKSHQHASSTRPGASRSRSSHSKAPMVAGTGVAALLGGGVLVMLTKPAFRRMLFAVIGLTIGISRACLGGGFTSSDSYVNERALEQSLDDLHYAACIGNPEEVRWLLENGTPPDVVDTDGNTPLFIAVSGCSTVNKSYRASAGHEAVARVLIDYGASPTAANARGETPLHWAAAYGNAEITQTLITSGASGMVLDSNQSTPLHWAAQGGNQGSAEILVNQGVPLSPQNDDGDTPLDVARSQRRGTSVAKFLESQGAVAVTSN